MGKGKRAGWAARARSGAAEALCTQGRERPAGRPSALTLLPTAGHSHWEDGFPAHTGVSGILEPSSQPWLLIVPRGSLGRNDSRTRSVLRDLDSTDLRPERLRCFYLPSYYVASRAENHCLDRVLSQVRDKVAEGTTPKPGRQSSASQMCLCKRVGGTFLECRVTFSSLGGGWDSAFLAKAPGRCCHSTRQ